MSNRIVAVVTAACLGIGTGVSFAAADTHTSRQVSLEREALGLIEDIEEGARDIQYHGSRLQTLGFQADVSRMSHAHHLESIRDIVNGRMRPALIRLRSIEKSLPEWKQDSIDRMLASAQELVKDTNSSFLAKNSRPLLPVVLNAEYQTLVREVVVHAEALIKTADAAHSYAEGHLKAAEAGLVKK